MHKSGSDIFRKNIKAAQRLDDCLGKLIKEYDPERIILFGSCARGEPKHISTIDLMVIAKSKVRFFERIRKALDLCKGGPPSFEVIVYTPEEFDQLWQQGEGFLEDALEEGVVLYDKE